MRGFLDEDDARDPGRDTVNARSTEITGVVGKAARGGFFFHAGDRDVFVPFSILEKNEPAGAMMHTITVPEWWARKEQLL